jgi:hypothetical protein
VYQNYRKFNKDPSVSQLSWIPNHAYDRLLSENIVFIDLHDTSAYNAVVECIVRNTPILINPLEAVKEYLGEDYPFYFSSLEEAEKKADDLQLVEETHNYLKNYPFKQKLTIDYFLESFINSEVYQNL